MSKDLRSPRAKARDTYIQSNEGKTACDASTLGTTAPNYYLQNRIEAAFLAGMTAQRNLSESPSDQGWRPIDHGEVIVTGDKIQTRLNGRVDAYAWLVGTRYKDGCAPMYRKLPNPPTGEIKEQE